MQSRIVCMLKNDDFVIANKQLGNIVINSVGVIRAINGKSAMVLFISADEIKKVDFTDLEPLDIYKTGKGYGKKICNICHSENNIIAGKLFF